MIYIKRMTNSDFLDEIVRADEPPTESHIELTDEQAIEVMSHPHGFGVFELVNGELIPNGAIVQNLDAIKSRKAEYPAIEDQLDMIFHDLENGTQEWQGKIRAIKAKYPKV